MIQLPSKIKPPSRCLAVFCAGLIAPLGFSPFDYWPVLMLMMAVVFLFIRNTKVGSAAGCGLLFGTGLFGAGVSWVYVSIHQFGAASVPLAALLTALFVLGLAVLFIVPCFALYAGLRQAWSIQVPWQQALLFSSLWVLFEWLRSGLLTGFPWLYAGYAFLDTPAAAWAPVTGIYGLSLLLVASSSLLVALCLPDVKQRRSTGVLIGLMLAPWLAAVPLAQVPWTTTKETMTVSAIQGNIPQDSKWDPDFIDQTLATYVNLTAYETQQDLVIWPENAIPLYYSRAKPFIQQLDKQAKSQGITLITGMPIDEQSAGVTRYYNGVVALGQGQGHYYKQKLVPFGEYVPLANLLRGLIAFFDLPMSHFSAGAANQRLIMANALTLATYICYEVVYPDFAAALAKGAGLLVTISNDSWFGRSIGPAQHFQMARMRALETGRYLVRATNDGITAVISARGQVMARIPRFRTDVLRSTVKVMVGDTPFMVTGSWPVLGLCFLLLLLLLLNSAFKPIRKE